MIDRDAIVKQARNCHTKKAWNALFDVYGGAIATATKPKLIHDLFKLLVADPQSLQYDPGIWGAMIKGSLSSWDLSLAREIAIRVKKIPSPSISIPAAQMHLEYGDPAQAREIASRSLRLINISPPEKLQLELLVARSYAEEGKRQKSIRMLSKIRSTTDSPILTPKQRADLLTDLGRMQFFLGRYIQAGEHFYEASHLFLNHSDWEAAAKTKFNAASCFLNSGTRSREDSFLLIDECKKLSITHGLEGPLSHCEAAYGISAFEQGDFTKSLAHLRRALSLVPSADHDYRKTHLLASMAFIYLALGQFHLAQKIGKRILAPKSQDNSRRSQSRHIALRAELLWEEGSLTESQQALQKACTPPEMPAIHTLDELSTLSRFRLQSAYLGAKGVSKPIEISDSLKKNAHENLRYQFAQGQIALNGQSFSEALNLFQQCAEKAKSSNDAYHEALGSLGIIQTHLSRRNTASLNESLRDFERQISKFIDTPLRTQINFILAARSYQTGDFAECRKQLNLAQKLPRQNFQDAFVLQGWLATIEGRSFRMTTPWQKQLMARFTRIYFAPTVETIDRNTFKISEHYIVSLDRHPALATLLQHLMRKSSFSATTTEIQTQVWKQSLNLQGWQQKIRNTIMRIRDFFPYTMAPLILHDEAISLFHEALELTRTRQAGLGAASEIQQILRERPMSSLDLSRYLDLSPATTKRLLKKMTEEHAVVLIKLGRNVVYKTQIKESDVAG